MRVLIYLYYLSIHLSSFTYIILFISQHMDKEKIKLSACFLYELEDRKVGEMATRPQLDHICWSGLSELIKYTNWTYFATNVTRPC